MICTNARANRCSLLFSATVVAASIAGLGAANPKQAQAQAPPTASAAATPAPLALVPVDLPAKPPKGAIVLLGGGDAKTADLIRSGWYRRYTKEPATWTTGKDGAVTPQKSDIVTREEFGDCYLHAEFRTAPDENGKPVGHGNSGIGFQGRYEVQILGDYGEKPDSHGAGALYSQKPPMVNASRKRGEWQTFDIVFRAPRFDTAGQVIEKPRVTAFQNGILVQNNEEFTGMTGIQYGEYKQMTKTGPLLLQGDHDVVQFRNVWIVPIPATE